MDRPNRNPVWIVTDTTGRQHHVFACDELQAAEFVRRARRRTVAAVVRADRA